MRTVTRGGQAPEWRQRRAERLDRLLALPMLVLTLVFLVVMVLPVLFPRLPSAALAVLQVVDLSIWAVFIAEYLARLLVAPNRIQFIVRNPFDLLVVVIPVLRPLRLLRLARIGAGAGRAVRESQMSLAGRAALLASGSAVIIVLAAAVMELDVERAAPNATITTFSDALWWTMSTVTTVGYGDYYPVTAAGRAVGIVLMIIGVGIVGAVSASVAAWFVSDGRHRDSRQQDDAISILTAEVAALRQTLRELREQIPVQSAPPAQERSGNREPPHPRPPRP